MGKTFLLIDNQNIKSTGIEINFVDHYCYLSCGKLLITFKCTDSSWIEVNDPNNKEFTIKQDSEYTLVNNINPVEIYFSRTGNKYTTFTNIGCYQFSFNHFGDCDYDPNNFKYNFNRT